MLLGPQSGAREGQIIVILRINLKLACFLLSSQLDCSKILIKSNGTFKVMLRSIKM